MAQLDLRSIVFLSGVMGVVLSMVMYAMRRSFPASIKGMGAWTVAPALIFAATMLFALQGTWPDFWTIAVGNMLFLAGIQFFYIGMRHFYGKPVSLPFMASMFVLSTVLLVFFVSIRPNLAMRDVVANSFSAGLAFGCVWTLLASREKSFVLWFLVVILLAFIGVTSERVLMVSIEGRGRRLFEDSASQSLYVLVHALVFLSFCVGLIRLASERLRAELEHLASHDPLTNTLTRRALIAECDRELERCRRHGRTMALLMLDLDHFKTINDSHGHLQGDAVLLDFVRRVTETLRGPDRLGRYGGEEFVVLLPEIGLDEALMVAERIRGKVAEQAPGLPACTVSIGVTVNRPGEDRVDALLQRADEALYKAKSGGRNRVEVL